MSAAVLSLLQRLGFLHGGGGTVAIFSYEKGLVRLCWVLGALGRTQEPQVQVWWWRRVSSGLPISPCPARGPQPCRWDTSMAPLWVVGWSLLYAPSCSCEPRPPAPYWGWRRRDCSQNGGGRCRSELWPEEVANHSWRGSSRPSQSPLMCLGGRLNSLGGETKLFAGCKQAGHSYRYPSSFPRFPPPTEGALQNGMLARSISWVGGTLLVLLKYYGRYTREEGRDVLCKVCCLQEIAVKTSFSRRTEKQCCVW